MVREDTEPAEKEMGMRRFTVETLGGLHIHVQVLVSRDASVPDLMPVEDMQMSREAANNRQLLPAFVQLANHCSKSL